MGDVARDSDATVVFTLGRRPSGAAADYGLNPLLYVAGSSESKEPGIGARFLVPCLWLFNLAIAFGGSSLLGHWACRAIARLAGLAHGEERPMNPRMYLVAVGGGGVLAGLLWYPLAQYFPSLLVAGWPAANASLAWGLAALGAQVVFCSGMVAARLSGARGRGGAALCGAVAGAIASVLGYGLVGGSAAGVWGARQIIAHGLSPAANKAQMVQLLAEGCHGISICTAVALWGMIFAGMALGALGGLLAGSGGEPDRDMPRVYGAAAVAGILLAATLLAVSSVMFAALNRAILDAAQRERFTLTHSMGTVLVLQSAGLVLMLFGGQWLWWASHHWAGCPGQRNVGGGGARWGAVVMFAVPALALLFLLVCRPESVWLFDAPALFAATLVGAGMLWRVWKTQSAARGGPVTPRIIWLSVAFCVLALWLVCYLSQLPAAMGVAKMVVLSIGALEPDSTVVKDVAGLVREHYAAYFSYLAVWMVVALGWILILSGLLVSGAFAIGGWGKGLQEKGHGE